MFILPIDSTRLGDGSQAAHRAIRLGSRDGYRFVSAWTSNSKNRTFYFITSCSPLVALD
jgi:hypothetical protein